MLVLKCLILISCSFLAPPHLRTLHAQMRFLMSKAKASSTTKSQQSMLKSWHKYAFANQVTMPVGGWHLAMYATQLTRDGRITSADSLANYISAVSAYHKDLGMKCPTPSEFGPLDRVIKGFRNTALRPTRKTLPVTPAILLNFLNTNLPHPFCTYDQLQLQTYKILCLIFFLSMLRSSSLIPKSYKEVDPVRLLCWGNVQLIRFGDIQGVVFEMHKTKTIQNMDRVQQVTLSQNDDCPQLCPVRAVLQLRDIIGVRNIGPDTPLFQTRNYKGTLRPVLYHKFQQWFRFRLNEMGLDASKYSLHAWRHGGIQQALMSEQNLALVKLSSDHSSDVILEYSRVPADRRLIISQKVNRNLSTFVTGTVPDGPYLPSNVLAHV